MPPTEEDVAWFRSTFHPIPKPALPDDCIEYSLYVISSSLDVSNDSELRLRLRDVQKHANELQRQYLKDYIWQRQGFSLEINKEDGLSFLRGRTEYGDSVEDEWVVVWLLREISKKFSDVWVKVTDTDGEFLLIEASGTLPAWLEPDVADNRVWIHDGKLKIIKPASNARTSRRTDEKLAVQQAREILLKDPKRLMHSTSMEEEAFFRLRNYPAQISDNMHHAIITVPRKIAYLLHQKPAYIAPAIEAFYLRDPIALKPLQTQSYREKMTFKPEDMVSVSIKFPKVCYAQLRSQDFPPPVVFNNALPSRSDSKAWTRAESGMKITCGFEMLVTDSQFQDRPAVREIKLLVDDLESGDETLPTDADLSIWPQLEDDEKWLDISFDDLEDELGGSKRTQPSANGQAKKKGGFGDKAAQENLQRIVKQFEDFLNDDRAGPEGAGLFDENSSDGDDDDDLDDDDDEDEDDAGEDKDASFNEDDFTTMMQEMMGMPSHVMKEIMSGKLGSGATDPALRSKLRPPPTGIVESEDDDDDNDEEDIQSFMKQVETELRPTGVLDLNSSSKKLAIREKAPGKEKPDVDDGDQSSSDDNSDNEVDLNLARNLLESLKSQAGTAGPGGNLMGMLGLGTLPRDEPDIYEVDDNDDDEHVQAGPSGTSSTGR